MKMSKRVYLPGFVIALVVGYVLYYFSPSLMYAYQVVTIARIEIGDYEVVMEKHWVPYYQADLNGRPGIALMKVKPFAFDQYQGKMAIGEGKNECQFYRKLFY